MPSRSAAAKGICTRCNAVRILTRTLYCILIARIAHFVWIAGCLAGVYALMRRWWSVVVALAAVAFVALQPRVFGHLLIASSDSLDRRNLRSAGRH